MTATAMESFLILRLIPINGVLAMAEITVVSARKMRLQQRVEQAMPDRARHAGHRAAQPCLLIGAARVEPSRAWRRGAPLTRDQPH